MSISAKTEYACLAVLDLAAAEASAEPIRVRCIAEAHGIPPRFLVQILLQLKGAGIVTSTRGAAGGYRLARDPTELSVWDVMSVVEGCETPLTSNAAVTTPASQALLETWRRQRPDSMKSCGPRPLPNWPKKLSIKRRTCITSDVAVGLRVDIFQAFWPQKTADVPRPPPPDEAVCRPARLSICAADLGSFCSFSLQRQRPGIHLGGCGHGRTVLCGWQPKHISSGEACLPDDRTRIKEPM